MATKDKIEQCKKQIEELEEDKARHQRDIERYQGLIATWQALLKSSTTERWRHAYESGVLDYESRLQEAKQQQASCDHALQVQQSQLAQLEQEFLARKKRHHETYKKAIRGKVTLKIRPVRINYIGLPRSGKTSFLRRLVGDFLNILKAGKCEQPSTGVAEDGGQVIIRGSTCLDLGIIQSKVWSLLNDLGEEAYLLDQFMCEAVYDKPTAESSVGGASASLSTSVDGASTDTSVGGTAAPSLGGASASADTDKAPVSKKPYKRLGSKILSSLRRKLHLDDDIDETFSIIWEAMEAGDWDTVRYLLDDLILLINTDTGGQAEFLDLQAALVQGPSFNLLFSRLVDKLDSQFKMYYTNEEGVSTEEEESTMTLKELLFQVLSNVASFSGCFSDDDDTCSGEATVKKLPRHSKSKVMFVGTYLDKVSEEEFKRKDQLLREIIVNTEFYRKGIIEFATDDQLMLAVDNMSGGQDEIDFIRKVLENVIEKSFEKIDIPAAWLMLSLYIRKMAVRTMSLRDCEKLAGKFRISPQELQEALWFLHHCIGVLLYYPEVEALKDTVICQIQVVYDSASNLIKNIFTFGNVGKMVCERFREKAQFSLKDVNMAMSVHTDRLIPVEKLVKLLEYRNVLTVIPPTLSSKGDCTREPLFFMPSVLRTARESDLTTLTSSDSDPAPLMLRYDCGYTPVGVFPAMITNLLSQQREDWVMIEEGLCKNRIQFYVGADCDTITLISHPQYFEFAISRSKGFLTPTTSLCAHVRHVLKSTLATVTQRMNYHFNMGYKLGFECPTHPGRGHLCVLTSETGRRMMCLHNPKKMEPITLEDRHKVWFQSPEEGVPASTGGHGDSSSIEPPCHLPPHNDQPCVPSSANHSTTGDGCVLQELPTGLRNLELQPQATLYQYGEPLSSDPSSPVPVSPSRASSSASGEHKAVPLSLKTLSLLKWKDEQGQEQTFRLGNKVSVDWEKFGVLLGLSRNQLRTWDKEYRGDVARCWEEMMEYWMTRGGSRDYPPTWEGLYTLLWDGEYSKVAVELKKAVTACSAKVHHE